MVSNKIYSEEKAREIKKRKERIEKAQYNKKSCARRKIEELKEEYKIRKMLEDEFDYD